MFALKITVRNLLDQCVLSFITYGYQYIIIKQIVIGRWRFYLNLHQSSSFTVGDKDNYKKYEAYYEGLNNSHSHNNLNAFYLFVL